MTYEDVKKKVIFIKDQDTLEEFMEEDTFCSSCCGNDCIAC